MPSLFFYDSPIGHLGVAANEHAVTAVYFESDRIPPDLPLCETPVHKQAGEELARYFAGNLRTFGVPLEPEGTAFFQSVWKALQEIPYGETRTYKQIAEAVGAPKAFRAVGLANNRNPIPLFIPCHRVVGSDGKLTGFRAGLAVKAKLLDLEAL